LRKNKWNCIFFLSPPSLLALSLSPIPQIWPSEYDCAGITTAVFFICARLRGPDVTVTATTTAAATVGVSVLVSVLPRQPRARSSLIRVSWLVAGGW